MTEYLSHIIAISAIYIIASSGLGLLVGFAGLISIMQGAFLGIGAYIYAIAAMKLGMPLIPSALLAVLGTALAGWMLGGFSIKLKGDYFALVTFALALIMYNLFNNLIFLTGGPMGIPGVPSPFSSQYIFVVICLLITGLLLLFLKMFVTSPYGRLLKAIREDEVLAASMGKNVRHVKRLAFILASLFAGVAGVLYACFISFVDPTGFSPSESIFILAIVLIGGAESVQGAVWGTLILIAIPELLRFLGLPPDIAAGTRQLILGILIVALMVFRPQGLAGRYNLY